MLKKPIVVLVIVKGGARSEIGVVTVVVVDTSIITIEVPRIVGIIISARKFNPAYARIMPVWMSIRH